MKADFRSWVGWCCGRQTALARIICGSDRMAFFYNEVHRTGRKYIFLQQLCSLLRIWWSWIKRTLLTLQSGDQVYSFYEADHISNCYHSALKTFDVLILHNNGTAFTLLSNWTQPQPADIPDILFLTWGEKSSGTFFICVSISRACGKSDGPSLAIASKALKVKFGKTETHLVKWAELKSWYCKNYLVSELPMNRCGEKIWKERKLRIVGRD